uniref:FBD domain-containing protein n=1 Tax=Triticum aestivum TaxID=4565 RepID=A0A3B6R8L5_WHEAT
MCRPIGPQRRRPVILPVAALIHAVAASPLRAIASRHVVPAVTLRLFPWLHHITRCRCVTFSGRSAAARGQPPHRGHLLLSTCKLLESLRLTHCDLGIHSMLQVEHARLIELEVDNGKFERVELTCLPKLQQIWVIPESPELLIPMLSKLQHVNLDHVPEGCDLAWTMFILEAAPSLKELCITWDHYCIMFTGAEFQKENGLCDKADLKWKPYAPGFKHKNQVKLTIYGFQPDDNFVRYMRCLAEAAVNMAEISLHDRKVCGHCGDLDLEVKDKICPSRYPRTAEEKNEVTEVLGLASRAVVHFWS